MTAIFWFGAAVSVAFALIVLGATIFGRAVVDTLTATAQDWLPEDEPSWAADVLRNVEPVTRRVSDAAP